jgi:hypothetical protein
LNKRVSKLCSLAFYGLLTIGKITHSEHNLQFQNVSVERNAVRIVFQSYKHSEGKPVVHLLEAQPSVTHCPVASLQSFLACRPHSPGPLFCTKEGKAIARGQICTELRLAFALTGLGQERFTSHSFRIGGATFLARQGASDAQIRQAGRWSTNDFTKYVRLHVF